jgi:hypothetical protein
MYKQLSFLFLWLCWIQLSANSSSQKIVNIAHSSWGTTVTASSTYSSQHGVYNLTDDRFEKGNSWLSDPFNSAINGMPQCLWMT